MKKPERELQTETMEKRLGQMKSGVIELCETISQVKKALCGNEKATNEELLQVASQVKDRLAQVERERDAAVADLMAASTRLCNACKYDSWPECGKTGRLNFDADDAVACKHFEWRGVCDENTKEE